MSDIQITIIGNGGAYVDKYHPENGDVVTLYANPFSGETLNDIYAVDGGGYSIAMAVTPVQSFTYNAGWGDVFITVEFSGSAPPHPSVLYWLIAKAANKWRDIK